MIKEIIAAAIVAMMPLDMGAFMSFSELKTRQEVQLWQMAEQAVSEDDIELCAKLVWGEARGVPSDAEKAAVIWCALNRLDDGGYGDTLYEVVTAPYQFTGYSKYHPVTDELYDLAKDVLTRYELEKLGEEESGRTLPENYLFFVGYDGRNWFRKTYRDPDPRWDWSLPDPYEE